MTNELRNKNEGMNLEPDYSFNQSIIDALRDGKTVWYKRKDINIWSQCNPYSNTLSTIYLCQWSLTKPKTMVKRQMKKWANVYHDDAFCCFSDKNNSIQDGESSKELYKAIAVPFTIEWEQEE